MAIRDNGGRAAALPYRALPFLIALFLASAAPLALRAAEAQTTAPSDGPISLLPGAATPATATPATGTPAGQGAGTSATTGTATGTATGSAATGATGATETGAAATSTTAGTSTSTGSGTGQPVTAGNGIGIGALAAPNPSDIGVLDTSQGALAPTLWQGSAAAVVDTLLPKLPASTSPAMQNLAARLLLSPGAVPAGATKGPSLLALRVRALLALGQVPGALALVRAAAAATTDAAFNRAAVDTYWLSGHSHAACGRAFQMARDSTSNGALEDVAFCHFLAGQHAAAGIDVDLLREQKGIDPAFFQIYARLTGFRRKTVSSLSDPTPLLLAMLAATKDPPPPAIVEGAAPAVAYFVARMAHAPLSLRLIAGEQAVAQGGLAPDMLRKLYASVPFSETDLADPAKVAAKLDDARGNALMYQAVGRENEPLAEAEALQSSFALAKKLSGSALPVYRAEDKRLQALAPTHDLAWFAPDAVRALLTLGRPKAAAAWYALIAAGGQTAASGADGAGDPKAAAQLAPLMALAGAATAAPTAAPAAAAPTAGAGAGAGADPGQALAAWYAAADPTARDAEAGLLFTLSEALGEKVPASLWLPLYRHTALTMATTPPAALRHGLARAATGKRIGETVMFSLVNLGPGGPTVASAATLADVVAALEAVGLDKDARRIAVEAALGGV